MGHELEPESGPRSRNAFGTVFDGGPKPGKGFDAARPGRSSKVGRILAGEDVA